MTFPPANTAISTAASPAITSHGPPAPAGFGAGPESPGISGISALNRSFGGWLGWSGMCCSPRAVELSQLFILRTRQERKYCDLNKVLVTRGAYYNAIVCSHDKPSNLQRNVRHPGGCALWRALETVLVKWLQNPAEGLSQTFGHPTVITKRSRPIFASVIG
jgi:hypothetical protein